MSDSEAKRKQREERRMAAEEAKKKAEQARLKAEELRRKAAEAKAKLAVSSLELVGSTTPPLPGDAPSESASSASANATKPSSSGGMVSSHSERNIVVASPVSLGTAQPNGAPIISAIEESAIISPRVEEVVAKKEKEDMVKKAEEEAAAKANAEEEARKKAEVAKRKEEEEATKKVEAEAAAKAKAEMEARKKADEETKRKADQESKKKAEEEAAAAKAEEEAKKKAEEELKKAVEEAKKKSNEVAKKKEAQEAEMKAEETAQRAQVEARKFAEEKAKEDEAEKVDEKKDEEAKARSKVTRSKSSGRSSGKVHRTKSHSERETNAVAKDGERGKEKEKEDLPPPKKMAVRRLSSKDEKKGAVNEEKARSKQLSSTKSEAPARTKTLTREKSHKKEGTGDMKKPSVKDRIRMAEKLDEEARAKPAVLTTKDRSKSKGERRAEVKRTKSSAREDKKKVEAVKAEEEPKKESSDLKKRKSSSNLSKKDKISPRPDEKEKEDEKQKMAEKERERKEKEDRERKAKEEKERREKDEKERKESEEKLRREKEAERKKKAEEVRKEEEARKVEEAKKAAERKVDSPTPDIVVHVEPPAENSDVDAEAPNKAAVINSLLKNLKMGDPHHRQRSASVDAANLSTPQQQKSPLTHITKTRAKAANRTKRASINPVRNRPGTYQSPESAARKKSPFGMEAESPSLPSALARLKGISGGSRKERARSMLATPQDLAMAGLVSFESVQVDKGDPNDPKGPIFDAQAVLKKRRGSMAIKAPPKPKLIRISGKNRIHVRLRQVDINAKELNDANVFILNSLDAIWVWHGKKVNKMERTTALDITTRMNRNEFGGRGKVVSMESGQEDPEFWDRLGGKAPVQDARIGEELREQGKTWDESDTLYVFNLETRQYEPVEGKRTQDLLKNDRSFVLDCDTEFYVWHGVKVIPEDKADANDKAEDLFKTKPRAKHVEIERANQGGEGVLFIAKFLSWAAEATLSGSDEVRGSIAKSKFEKQEKMDVERMHTIERPEVGKTMDDGKDGTLEIWTVDNFGKKELDKSEWGQFFTGKSYIILYTWMNATRHHLYFWQGVDSSVSDKGAAAGVVMDLNALRCKNAAIQERVPQYKEPRHFLLMFEQKFVVHKGESRSSSETRLYHGRGSVPTNTRLVEVPLDASRLYSGDVFALATPSKTFLWVGKSSTPYLKDVVAKTVASFSSTPVEHVAEGSEPTAFWSALGGKKAYCDTLLSSDIKFFYCDNKLGVFRADRVFDFTQAELNPIKYAIVDIGAKVYLWIGKEAKQTEKKIAVELVAEYIEKMPSNRGKVTGYYVHQGSEPLDFAAAFLGFHFEGKRGDDIGLITDLNEQFTRTFPYEQLKSQRGTLPSYIDQSRLEDYLSDEGFVEAFGCTKEEHAAKPAWKALQDKKKAGLY